MNVVISKDEKLKIISAMKRTAGTYRLYAEKYLELGASIIRVLCYSLGILPTLHRQLGYVLRDSADHYDGTIVVWNNSDVDSLLNDVCGGFEFKKAMRIRAEMLWAQMGNYPFDLYFFEDGSDGCTLGRIDHGEEEVELFDAESRTACFSCKSYEPEDFVKYGHVFVKQINRLVKSENVNLTHGAVIGYAGNGFLLCGRGKRGKSTLTVESMLQGFEYVSDDYQILKKTDDGLFAYPIYSIVTLSYRMYNEMYDRFLGKFVCNNFAQDKYLFNIAPYHNRFRTEYPIRFCLFPEITGDEHPSIVHCSLEEKGRAAVHLIHSTLIQMNDLGEQDTVRKLLLMVWDEPFFRFNLCNNIPENTEYLKQYLESMPELQPDASELPPLLLDITDDTATVLDTVTFRFTQMNKLASNVFVLLLSGTDPSIIKERLELFEKYNPNILDEFEILSAMMKLKDYYSIHVTHYSAADMMPKLASECNYSFSVTEIVGTETVELIKKT